MANRERPLSPHLQIYRWQITMVMSIFHRATGVALCLGAFGVAWWLLAVAQGGDTYAQTMACLSSSLGLVALAAFSLSLMYHTLNGLRHLSWDIGWGLSIPDVYRSGYAVAALTIVSTALIWFFALQGPSL